MTYHAFVRVSHVQTQIFLHELVANDFFLEFAGKVLTAPMWFFSFKSEDKRIITAHASSSRLVST